MALQIIGAVEAVVASGMELEEVTADGFRLPRLGKRLRDMQNEVVKGRGFVVIRGLPVQQMPTRRVGELFGKGESDAAGHCASV